MRDFFSPYLLILLYSPSRKTFRWVIIITIIRLVRRHQVREIIPFIQWSKQNKLRKVKKEIFRLLEFMAQIILLKHFGHSSFLTQPSHLKGDWGSGLIVTRVVLEVMGVLLLAVVLLGVVLLLALVHSSVLVWVSLGSAFVRILFYRQQCLISQTPTAAINELQ